MPGAGGKSTEADPGRNASSECASTLMETAEDAFVWMVSGFMCDGKAL